MRFAILSFLLFSYTPMLAQSVIGLQAGPSICLTGNDEYPKTVFSLRYKKQIERINLSFTMSYDRYYFYKWTPTGDGPHIDLKCTNNTSYVFIAPTFDFLKAKYKHWHLYVMPAVGVLTKVDETISQTIYTSDSVPNSFHSAYANPINPSNNWYHDTVFSNNQNVRNVVFRLGMELQKQIPITKNLNVGISLIYSHIFTKIADIEYYQGGSALEIRPEMLSFQLGVIYKLKK